MSANNTKVRIHTSKSMVEKDVSVNFKILPFGHAYYETSSQGTAKKSDESKERPTYGYPETPYIPLIWQTS